jgi:hypothetical protein
LTISDATIYTDVFTSVRSLLVSTSNPIYVTNSTTSATTAAGIEAVYNDKVPTKPIIVIIPPQKTESFNTFDSSQGKKFINITLECYYSTTLGIDQMAQQVEHILKTNPIAGIDLIGITSDYAFTDPNMSKYHMKSITVSYDRE